MCVESSLSDKSRYPTFARTEPIGRQLTPAINEILSYFKWKKFALIVENSTMYKRAFKMIKEKFSVDVLAEAFMPPPAKYSYDEHFVEAREDMRKLKDKARSKSFALLVIMGSLSNGTRCGMQINGRISVQ